MLPVSLDCFCFVFLRPVPYVASFSGLSIFDCPFGVLYRLFDVLMSVCVRHFDP